MISNSLIIIINKIFNTSSNQKIRQVRSRRFYFVKNWLNKVTEYKKDPSLRSSWLEFSKLLQFFLRYRLFARQ